MSRTVSISFATDSSANPAVRLLGTSIEVLLAGLLIFAPLAFGTTEAWSQEVLVAGIGLLALLTVAHQLADSQGGFRWSGTYPLIALFILLVVMQALPLSTSLLHNLSPATVTTKTELLNQSGNSLGPTTPLSFYAFATKSWLRLLVSVSTLFIVILHEYRDTAKITRLLATIATSGFIVALLALYQNLSRTEMVFGVVHMQHRNAGPFMNYSHFSQFMNLSIGSAIALLLMWSVELKSRFSSPADLLLQFRDPRKFYLGIAFALCLLGPIVVMLSMSRMGMISMFCAAAVIVTLLSLRSRSSGRGSWLLLIAAAVLGITLLTGYDLIARRLATVQDPVLTTSFRVQILKDVVDISKRFPVFGTGLGTHEFVYPMFSHVTAPQIVAHAENEYGEILEECGLIGLLLVIGFIAVVLWNLRRAIWQPRTPMQFAAFGLGFGWIAVLVHSCSDFGQHTPAVAILTAIFAALILNIGSSVSSPLSAASAEKQRGFAFRGLVSAGALVVIVVTFGWSLTSLDRARKAAVAASDAQDIADTLEANQWQGDDDQFRTMLIKAGAAAALQPDNVELAHTLNVYRWHTLARSYDDENRTVTLPPEALQFVPQLKQSFQQTASLCPSYGPPISMIGNLKLFCMKDLSGCADIEAGYRLAPYDRTACEMAAMVAAQEGKWDQSLELFKKFVDLLGSPRVGLDYYLSLNAPQMAYELADGQQDRLMYLVERGKDDASLARLVTRCQQDADKLLDQQVHQPGAPARALADYAMALQRQGKDHDAIQWYRHALAVDYGQVRWRLSLAQLLANCGQQDEALCELRICKNLSSDSPEVASAIALVRLRGSDYASKDSRVTDGSTAESATK